jgi:hypothetical protein
LRIYQGVRIKDEKVRIKTDMFGKEGGVCVIFRGFMRINFSKLKIKKPNASELVHQH